MACNTPNTRRRPTPSAARPLTIKRPPSDSDPAGAAAVRGDKHPRMGNSSSSISVAHSDSPPDEIFQVRVTNAGNSCYMDSVLFAMFAMPSAALDAMLTRRPPASDHLAAHKLELQACIMKHFVGRLRHCEHVTSESMINIRSLCRRVGWEYAGAPDLQQDAGEFFAFLHSALGGQLIRTTRRTFTGALPDNSDRGSEENMALLPVALRDSHPARSEDMMNLSSLVDTFFFENVAAGLRREVQGQQQEVYALNTYSVENVPSVVAVALKRFDEQLLKIENEVDFPAHLNFHKYSGRLEWRSSPIMLSVPWTLKSVVCHRGRSTQSGHYYAYTRYSKNASPSAVWLRLDDESTPCITQTNIWQDPYVKSEAVLFLYELDTDAHTAAMMMLQEEESEGMFEQSGGAVSFGFDAFGFADFEPDHVGAGSGPRDDKLLDIPRALPASMLSALGGSASIPRQAGAGECDVGGPGGGSQGLHSQPSGEVASPRVVPGGFGADKQAHNGETLEDGCVASAASCVNNCTQAAWDAAAGDKTLSEQHGSSPSRQVAGETTGTAGDSRESEVSEALGWKSAVE